MLAASALNVSKQKTSLDFSTNSGNGKARVYARYAGELK
jgi:hypothetical protein